MQNIHLIGFKFVCVADNDYKPYITSDFALLGSAMTLINA